MSTNKKSYPTTMGWRELVNIYREFGDNAQQCVDFVIDNIQPKADGYRMGFTQSPLRIFNKMVKFKPDGVYIMYNDGHNEKFDGHNGKAGVRAIGLSHDAHCFGIALKDAGEYKLVRDFNECPSQSSTYIDSECMALVDWDYKLKTKLIKDVGTDIPLKKDEYIPTLPMLVLMGAYKYEINKALKYVGGEAIKEDRYWSSTEGSDGYAWIVGMDNGTVYNTHRNYMYRVRPVSAFSL